MSAYSFVSVSELRDYMSGIGLDADQSSAMQDVLDGLQRELERYCRRVFTRKERTEVIVADEMGRLWPSATPVVSVSTPGLWARGNEIVGSSTWGYTAGDGFYGGVGPHGVSVTYVGGLDPDDGDFHDVRLAILRVAAREATTRHDDVLDPNDLSARHVAPADRRALGWLPEELAKFDRLRRRTVV